MTEYWVWKHFHKLWWFWQTLIDFGRDPKDWKRQLQELKYG
jgi:hypothetical protein